MTCVELRESLAENENGSRADQRLHLMGCVKCAALLADLLAIASTAAELRADNEPSPRVWNSIEIELRREGLIRPQRGNRSLLPGFASSGWWRWLAPAAALLLITVGIYVRQQSITGGGVAQQARPAVAKPASDAMLAGLNDDDLMQSMAQQPPETRAMYTNNLRLVNEYIRDAQTTVAAEPNDEDARRSLMEAYQQKAMLFELALDRSLQ